MQELQPDSTSTTTTTTTCNLESSCAVQQSCSNISAVTTSSPILLGLIVHFSSNSTNGKTFRPIAPRLPGCPVRSESPALLPPPKKFKAQVPKLPSPGVPLSLPKPQLSGIELKPNIVVSAPAVSSNQLEIQLSNSKLESTVITSTAGAAEVPLVQCIEQPSDAETKPNVVTSVATTTTIVELPVNQHEQQSSDAEVKTKVLVVAPAAESINQSSSHNKQQPSDVELNNSVNLMHNFVVSELSSSSSSSEAAAAVQAVSAVIVVEDDEDKNDLIASHGLYTELPESNFECKLCKPNSRRYPGKAEVLRHLLRAHASSRACECSHCPLSFDYRSKLSEHTIAAHSETSESLDRVKPELLECSYCSHRSVNDLLLGLHVLRRHARQYGYVCSTCARCFRTWPAKSAHECSAHKKGLPCNDCSRVFTSKRLLEKHQRKLHGQPDDLVCKDCSDTFASRKLLDKHQWEVHDSKALSQAKLVRSRTASKRPAGSKKKVFQYQIADQRVACEICGKVLSCKDHMRLHMRTHTGEKPYKCWDCNRAFALINTMKVHYLSHQGIKPYRCNICSLNYSQRSALMTHWKNKHPHLPSPPPIQIQHYFDE